MHRLSQYIDSAPYLNTCIAYVNTLSRLHILIRKTDTTRLGNTLGSQSESSTRVVSQSESSNTLPESSILSPESSPLGSRTLLGSRLAIVYLNRLGSSTRPPPTTSAHTLTTDGSE